MPRNTVPHGAGAVGTNGKSHENNGHGANGQPHSPQSPGERETGCPVDFPAEVFPKPLRRFVRSVARAMPCPVDFPGVLMLPVLGACIGRKRHVRVKASWPEYPLVWAGVIAGSGKRKTPAFKEATEPLRRRQRQLLADYLQEKEKYEATPADDRAPAKRPRLRQVQTTDATIEAVKLVLDGNPDGICYPADELSGWLRSLGQYKGGKGSDRQHWLSIWSGVQVVCNRATRPEPTIIDNPFVAITGGFQPATVGDLVANGREDGLAARFLLAWPGAPENTAWTEDVVKGADDYHDICKGLWELPQCDEPVTLTSEAKARWVGWVNAHREQKPPPMLEPVWSKAEGYCLRLALILHLARRACNEGKGAQVGREDVEGAIELARYFMAHAKRIYAGHASDGDHTPAGRALSWVAKRRDRGFTTHPARLMHMNGLCKTTDDANRMCRYLAETGHGRLVVGTRGGTALVTDRPG